VDEGSSNRSHGEPIKLIRITWLIGSFTRPKTIDADCVLEILFEKFVTKICKNPFATGGLKIVYKSCR